MSLLSFLGLAPQINTSLTTFLEKGAVIIDVRTPNEFLGGHIKKSKNIPLNEISSRINEIRSLNKPVIVCCQSGMRSSQAVSLLQKNNVEVINGGGWQKLNLELK